MIIYIGTVTTWRVYLLDGEDAHGRRIWREFGHDYASSEAAQAAAAPYRNSFPGRVYRVRKVQLAEARP